MKQFKNPVSMRCTQKQLNEVSLNPDGGYQEIEVKDEIIVSDSEIKPNTIKVIDKVKSDLKKAKKKVKLLTEVLKYLENGI